MMRMFEEVPRIVYEPVHAAIKHGEYRCDACGGVFSHGWSDEEALAESAALFGNLRPEDRSCVCDDCFKIICPSGDT